MKLLGHPFACIAPEVEEDVRPGESPERHVTRLSMRKAESVGAERTDGIVIGADTVVVLDGEIMGKPASPDEAVEMVMKLQDNTHTVYTGFALFDPSTRKVFSDHETTRVTMRRIPRELARRYVETGEPLDKAGAYGIQGYGAVLVTSIEGCYFNVMGLPLARLMEALYRFTDGGIGYFGRENDRAGKNSRKSSEK